MLSSVRLCGPCGEAFPNQQTSTVRAILIRFLGLSIRYLAMSAEIRSSIRKDSPYGLSRSRFRPQ